jgi:hypothetical protein
LHTATLYEHPSKPGVFQWLASNGNTVYHHPLYWMPCPEMPPKEKT